MPPNKKVWRLFVATSSFQ